MSTTPQMGLVLPTDHGSADAWDTILDAIFAVIDSHTHKAGSGVRINSSAILIDGNLSFSSGATPWQAINLGAVDFTPVAASSAASLAGALFLSSADNNLYWRTTAGSNVQITAGAALNVSGFTGGIAGDYATAGAQLYYDASTGRYLFDQTTGGLTPSPWAGIAAGNVDIYQQAVSITKRVRLQSPAALAASYALTLPPALPAAAQMLTVSAAGVTAVDGVLGTNQNLTLQGTGYLRSTTGYNRNIPFGIGVNTVTGTVGITASTAGYSMPANAVAFFPLTDVVDNNGVLQSVQVWTNATTGSLTQYQIFRAVQTDGSFASISSIVNSAQNPLITVTTPNNAVFFTYWLKVTVGNAVSGNVLLYTMTASYNTF